jgi:hypothetical protein
MQDKNDKAEILLQELGAIKEKDAITNNLRQKLSEHINDLVNSDFEKLVQLLYRLDIDEKKLKKVLQDNPGQNAGEMISELIIERQLQKIKSRQQFSQQKDDIDENEKW